jgi:hypothetical protein
LTAGGLSGLEAICHPFSGPRVHQNQTKVVEIVNSALVELKGNPAVLENHVHPVIIPDITNHTGHNNCVSNERPPAVFLCLSHNCVIRYPLSEHIRIKCQMFENDSGDGSLVRNSYIPQKSLKDFIVSKGAEKIYKEPNAGGSSVNSEALSADLFHSLFNVTNIITEMEIDYEVMNWKKCDYLMDVSGETFGVSVTRAMKYPSPNLYDYEDAELLLSRKLSGLVVARSGIVNEDYNFTKSILHIWCQTQKIAEIVSDVYNCLDEASKDNIIVMLTVSAPQCDYIYYDKLDKSLHKKFQQKTK